MPGVIGDPHLSRIDGASFEFRGRPGCTYRLLEQGETQVRATLKALPGIGSGPPRTVMADLTICVGAVTVAVPLDGKVRVWSPRFDLALHALICTLPGHDPSLADAADGMNETPYLNAELVRRPDDLAGASGLLIDGDGSPEAEARHLLHDPAAAG